MDGHPSFKKVSNFLIKTYHDHEIKGHEKNSCYAIYITWTHDGGKPLHDNEPVVDDSQLEQSHHTPRQVIKVVDVVEPYRMIFVSSKIRRKSCRRATHAHALSFVFSLDYQFRKDALPGTILKAVHDAGVFTTIHQ